MKSTVYKRVYACVVCACMPLRCSKQSSYYSSSGDPWFHGCWFLRPSESVHLPTHLFYPKELLMSNIADTNPMRSVIGKCTVLSFKEYCTCKSSVTFAENYKYRKFVEFLSWKLLPLHFYFPPTIRVAVSNMSCKCALLAVLCTIILAARNTPDKHQHAYVIW